MARTTNDNAVFNRDRATHPIWNNVVTLGSLAKTVTFSGAFPNIMKRLPAAGADEFLTAQCLSLH
jgi:hypothetical protein